MGKPGTCRGRDLPLPGVFCPPGNGWSAWNKDRPIPDQTTRRAHLQIHSRILYGRSTSFYFHPSRSYVYLPFVLLYTATKRLYDLKVGITPVKHGSPHERPHKPLLLLATFDLIDTGLATPDQIPWSQKLRALSSKALLLPQYGPFHPDQVGQEWRCERLIA